MAYYERANTLYDTTVNSMHTTVFSADQEQNECYHFKDILKQVDKNGFIKSMIKEVRDHERR